MRRQVCGFCGGPGEKAKREGHIERDGTGRNCERPAEEIKDGRRRIVGRRRPDGRAAMWPRPDSPGTRIRAGFVAAVVHKKIARLQIQCY